MDASSLLRTFLLILAACDGVLAFVVIHDQWFFEEPEGKFFLRALDASTLRVGQVLVIISVLVGIYVGALLKPEDVEREAVSVLRLIFTNPPVLIGAVATSSIAAIILSYAFLTGPRFDPPVSQGSTGALVTPDNAEIYLADEHNGVVLWQDLDSPHAPSQAIAIGQETSSGWVPGQPSRLAFVAPTQEILVTDIKFNTVVVIDRRTHRRKHIIAGVGFAPRSIVVTPDGHKAYVSSEQPIPSGNIAVIDLQARPYPVLLNTRIAVPTPEGLAIKGRRMYAATQSGAGKDPVFIVSTAADTVEDWIPDFAVGSAVAIAGPRASKVFVARGNMPITLSPKQSPLGIIDISRRRPKVLRPIPLAFDIPMLTATKDGNVVLVVNGQNLTLIDARTNDIIRTIPLDAGPSGLAVTEDSVYVWFPSIPKLFTFALRSLLPGKSDAQFYAAASTQTATGSEAVSG